MAACPKPQSNGPHIFLCEAGPQSSLPYLATPAPRRNWVPFSQSDRAAFVEIDGGQTLHRKPAKILGLLRIGKINTPKSVDEFGAFANAVQGLPNDFKSAGELKPILLDCLKRDLEIRHRPAIYRAAVFRTGAASDVSHG